MIDEFHMSLENDDYSEVDLIRWMNKSTEFKSNMTSLTSTQINKDPDSTIYLVRVKNKDEKLNAGHVKTSQSLMSIEPNLNYQEKFVDVLGPVALENEGRVIKHIGLTGVYAYARGHLLSHNGVHTIRFKIEKCNRPYRIFCFGCSSSEAFGEELIFKSSSSVGWFGFDQVYEHGRCTTNFEKYN